MDWNWNGNYLIPKNIRFRGGLHTNISERRLPEPFLRRCVYHHIRFNDDLIKKVVEARRDLYSALPDNYLETALQRFIALREKNLRKIPSTGEYLVWLRVLALAAEIKLVDLEENVSKLPSLGVLLKDHQDLDDIKN